MTVNAIGFYAVAALIVIAAAATVGLASLRLAAYAGGATVVLLGVLEIISGAYGLAVVQLVVPGIAAAVITAVLRHDEYRALGMSSSAGARWRVAAPVALGVGAVIVVTVGMVGAGWYPGPGLEILPLISRAALVTVLHYRALYALVIAVALVAVTVGAALVIGRRSGDEHALDQHIRLRREREERARRRREDREQGRRRPTEERP